MQLSEDDFKHITPVYNKDIYLKLALRLTKNLGLDLDQIWLVRDWLTENDYEELEIAIPSLFVSKAEVMEFIEKCIHSKYPNLLGTEKKALESRQNELVILKNVFKK